MVRCKILPPPALRHERTDRRNHENILCLKFLPKPTSRLLGGLLLPESSIIIRACQRTSYPPSKISTEI